MAILIREKKIVNAVVFSINLNHENNISTLYKIKYINKERQNGRVHKKSPSEQKLKNLENIYCFELIFMLHYVQAFVQALARKNTGIRYDLLILQCHLDHINYPPLDLVQFEASQ